jgi:hypothetical protein
MKMLFRGWQREVVHHYHDVTPVTKTESGNFKPGEADDPLTWNSAFKAYGKLENLALSGSFLVEFSFEQKELREWLREFVQAKPESAVRLLAEMQGHAIIALARRTEERLSSEMKEFATAPVDSSAENGA